MRASLNVLDDSWIPVITNTGARELIGIRGLLSRAHELRELSADSVLEEYSLYRFLSVFLMDALRPDRLSDIKKLLQRGMFDSEAIENYVGMCLQEGCSFDAFDSARPFCQSPFDEQYDKEPKPVCNLDPILPSGNNHTHFDHRKETQITMPQDKAMRMVLTIQQFCTAAAQGYPSGVNASPPYFMIVRGSNLFETLVYTLRPIRTIGIPFDEPPVLWRSKEAVVPKKPVGQTSWLRGMFFPARRVMLVAPENRDPVQMVYLSQGENYENKESWKDPFVTYRVLDSGIAPLRPKREKPIWRSLCEIINIPGQHAAQILEQYINISDCDLAEITLYGVETSNASYLGVFRENISIPIEITSNPEKIELLKICVEKAEQLARRLRHSLTDTQILSASVGENAVQSYYQRCEQAFWLLCEGALKTDNIRETYKSWCGQIGQFAMDSNLEATQRLNLRGRDLGRIAGQQRLLMFEINKINKEADE